MPLLLYLDSATGLLVRRLPARCYEHPSLGDLVHVDIKKLGRIPDGGVHRMLGRVIGKRHDKRHGRGYAFLHHTIDSYSGLVHSEQHTDERKETAAGFCQRANAFFETAGFTVTAVMTDNSACYRSQTFAAPLGDISHRRTRLHRPQTTGQVERFNRTLASEWADNRLYSTDEAHSATYPDWIHHYNHHRPHTGIHGLTPAERGHNLPGEPHLVTGGGVAVASAPVCASARLRVYGSRGAHSHR